MKTSVLLRDIMKKKRVKPMQLANRLGISPQALNGRLNQDNISIDKLDDMLRMMDYRIVVLPDNVRTPNGGYEVD